MADRLTFAPNPPSPSLPPTGVAARRYRDPAGPGAAAVDAARRRKADAAAAREERVRAAEARQAAHREAEARRREAEETDARATQARGAAEAAAREEDERKARECRVQFNIRLAQAQAADGPETRDRRERLANLCRYLLADAAGQPPLGADPTRGLHLSPRVRQTLNRLLVGDSEKQVARELGVSTHTVHVYIKTLYGALGVNSRSELLAKFVRPPGA